MRGASTQPHYLPLVGLSRDNTVPRPHIVTRFWIDAEDKPTNSAILVGHSHLFRALLKSNMDPAFKAECPVWTRALSRKKLDNGACLCIEVRPNLSTHALPEA